MNATGARMQDSGGLCGAGFHQRGVTVKVLCIVEWLSAAELEAPDPVDAGLGQSQVELVVVAGHRLHRADQVTVRVVEAEAVVDVDGDDVEADRRSGAALDPATATRRTGRR